MNLLHLPGAPSIPTEDYANYPVMLTTLGVRFVERLLLDGTEPQAPEQP